MIRSRAVPRFRLSKSSDRTLAANQRNKVRLRLREFGMSVNDTKYGRHGHALYAIVGKDWVRSEMLRPSERTESTIERIDR